MIRNLCLRMGLWVVLSLLAFAVQAQTTYYSKSTMTNFSTLADWGINTDGTGTAPGSISFTDHFVVRNGASITTLGTATSVNNLTIETGSLLINNTLTVAGNLTVTGGTFTVSDGSSRMTNVAGNVSISGGTIAPGAGTATLAFNTIWGTSSFNCTVSPLNWNVQVNSTATVNLTANFAIAASRTLTVNGHLNLTTDGGGNSYIVSGAGTVSVAADGRIGIQHTASNVVVANVATGLLRFATSVFAVGSIVELNAAGNQTVDVTNYPTNARLSTGGSGTKTINGNLSFANSIGMSNSSRSTLFVASGTTFADGGNSLTFNHTSSTSGADPIVDVAGAYTSTGSGAIVFANSTAGGGIRAVNGTVFGDLILTVTASNPIGINSPSGTVGITFRNITYSGVGLTASTFAVIRLNATGVTNVTVTGNINNNPSTPANAGFQFNGASAGATIFLQGNLNSTSTSTSWIPNANAATSPIIAFSGSSAQTITLGVNPGSALFQSNTGLTLNNAAGITLAGTGRTVTVTGTFRVTQGNITPGANTWAYSGATILEFNGTTAYTTDNIIYPNTAIHTLRINNSGGVILHAARSVTTLDLTLGNLTTSITNLLTVTGTAAANVLYPITGLSYVNGPLARTLPNSLVTPTNYIWPVGKSTFNVFTMASLTFAAASSPVIRVEAFDDPNGGTAGANLASINTDRYWSVALASGSATVATMAPTLFQPFGLSATNAVTFSSTLGGTYASLGGNFTLGVLASNTNQTTITGFYVVGTKGSIATGTYTIGPSGDYANLAAVANTLNSVNLAGPVTFEFNAAYNGATDETVFPIIFNVPTYTGIGSPHRITIRPAASAGAKVISGSSAFNPMIDFSGIDHLTLDGREGGTGTTRSLEISNTSTAFGTIRFANDAQYDTVRYVNIRGAVSTTGLGVITLASGLTTAGNDGIEISNNGIYNNGSGTPLNGIVSTNSTGSSFNDSISIRNNEIYNFFHASAASCGVNVTTGNRYWTISGNHFYQTGTRTSTSGLIHSAIAFSTSSAGIGNIVENNSIGGSTTACGGTAWTLTGSNNRFRAIELASLGTSVETVVRGNRITNFNFTTTSGTSSIPGVFCGINAASGAIRVGGTIPSEGNIIGSLSGQDSILVSMTTGGTFAFTTGIAAASANISNIYYNQIGGISTSVTNANSTHGIRGIWITAGASTVNVYGNTIGNATANNIRFTSTSASATTSSNGDLTGVWSSAAVIHNVDSTTIRNFNSALANSGSSIANTHLAGINLAGAANHTVQRSNINNLTAAGWFGLSGSLTGVVGILVNVPGGTHTISRNVIHSISNSNTTNTNHVTGILYNSASLGIVSRNFVHSLSNGSPVTTSSINGISSLGGTSVVHNNMVRLGRDATGANITFVGIIHGIVDNSSTVSAYFNSVHITGSCSSSARSYAFRSQTTFVNRIFRNNIFSMTRTNTGAGNMIAIEVGGSGNPQALLTVNNNIYYAAGTGTVLGRYNSVNYTTLQGWRVNTGQDANSASGDPNFVAPDANAATVSLKVQSPTPAEGVGAAIASYDTEDYEGEVRASFGPVDIGADAGTYTLNDLYTPIFGSFTLLTNTSSVANRIISVPITDVGTGLPTSGANRPKVWFRRSAPSVSAWASTNATLTSGDGNNGTWEFTIDYSTIPVTPVGGDTYQYYFVAQDQATTPNVWFTNVDATTPVHPNVNTQTTASAVPSSYNVVATLPTTLVVGTGGDYTTLTGASGFFNAVNTSVLGGNTTVKVATNLTEDGAVPLFNTGMGGFTISIVPHDTSTVEKSIIMATTTQPMLRLYGVSGVIVDGRLSGSGQFLRLRSENATTGNIRPIVQINLGSSNITVRNCILESQTTNITDTLTGMINLGATGSNSNINIVANTFRSYSSNRNRFMVYSFNGTSNNNVTIGGTTAADGNTFQDVGVNSNPSYFIQTATNMGTGWVVRNNTFNLNNSTSISASTNAFSVVSFVGGGSHTISNNTFNFNASASNNANVVGVGISGTSVGNAIDWNYFNFSGTVHPSVQVNCIQMDAAGTGTNNIRNNRIYRSGTGTTIATTTFNGILANSTNTSNLVITGNRIGGADSTTGGAYLVASGTFSGINLSPGSSTTNSVQDNRIEALNLTSTSSNQFLINLTQGSFNVGTTTGNVIGSSGKSIFSSNSLYGIQSVVSSPSTVNISNNNIGNLVMNASDFEALGGIRVAGSAAHTVSSNTIDSLTYRGTQNASIDFVSQFVPFGIEVSTGGTGNNAITQNTISRISFSANTLPNTSTWAAFGIRAQAGASGSSISRNRIFDFTTTRTGTSANAPVLQGIYVTTFSGTIANNQVSIINSVANTQPLITGIHAGSSNAVNVWNNTVVIGGTAAAANSTYALRRTLTSGTHSYRNNILLNERSGSGSHFAIGTTSATGWGSVTSSNNVLISSSASTIGEYVTGTSRTFSEWVTSASESNSISTQSGAVSAAAMFSGLSTGDLSTNHCMAAYGGVAGLVAVDYAGATRNTPTSIGSTEITSVSTPGLWTGRSSTNSATAVNWCGNAVPSSGTAVDIASYAVNQPTLTADLSTGNVTIPAGSTLTASTFVITPSASSTVNITGTVNTANANGLSNNATATISNTNSPSLNLNSGSTIEYSSASAQTVSALSYQNLTLSGGATNNMGGNVTVNGAFNLSNGSLNIGANILSLNGAITASASNAIAGNGSSNLVIGSTSSGNPFFASGSNALNNFTLNRATTLGNAVEVRGVLTASSGTLTTGGFLTMGSGATYQGMVDFSGAGSVSGNVIAQRYISGINDAWRGFSAPVAATYSDISATVDLGTQGVNGSNLITLRDMDFWTGANWQKASNWRIAADTNINAIPAGTITAGRGFLAYGGTAGIANLSSPVTLDLTGSLNSSMISAPGLVSSNRAYNGWMMMGNPYLATLDWESMYGTADVANLNATIYLYNTTYGSWDSYNAFTDESTGSGTNLIAPFQAFMVKASNATVPTLNFRTSQTSTSASSYNFRQNNLFPIVRLNVKKNGAPIQTALTLVATQATAGLDADYDSQYPGSFNGHNFYSMTTGDYKLQHNSRPMPTTGIVEPYYFEFNGTGNYSIEPSLKNIDPTWTVMLEDKITGTMHNLRTSAYNFTHQATNRKDRFVLHLNAMTTAVNEVADNSAPIVAMQNGTLNVRFAGMAASRKLEVVDLSGKVLRTITMENATAAEIDLSDFAQAVYLLRATGNGTTSVTKFVNAR